MLGWWSPSGHCEIPQPERNYPGGQGGVIDHFQSMVVGGLDCTGCQVVLKDAARGGDPGSPTRSPSHPVQCLISGGSEGTVGPSRCRTRVMAQRGCPPLPRTAREPVAFPGESAGLVMQSSASSSSQPGSPGQRFTGAQHPPCTALWGSSASSCAWGADKPGKFAGPCPTVAAQDP